ncbi:MAG: hypothetical protein ACK5JF_05320 [Oscillospiraceae bacterium]
MAFEKVDRTAPMVGAIIITGYEVLANYRNQYVLAKSQNGKTPEPYVVWALDEDGDPHTGNYCTTLETAKKVFFERCCPELIEVEIDPKMITRYGAAPKLITEAMGMVAAAKKRTTKKMQKVTMRGVVVGGEDVMPLHLITHHYNRKVFVNEDTGEIFDEGGQYLCTIND